MPILFGNLGNGIDLRDSIKQSDLFIDFGELIFIIEFNLESFFEFIDDSLFREVLSKFRQILVINRLGELFFLFFIPLEIYFSFFPIILLFRKTLLSNKNTIISFIFEQIDLAYIKSNIL